MTLKRIFVGMIILIAAGISLSQQQDVAEKTVSEFKQLSGYAEYANRRKPISDQKNQFSSSKAVEINSLSIDINAITSLKGFTLKDQGILFHYDQGIERKSYFREPNGVRDVMIRFFVGSKGSIDAQEWIISEIALNSSLPVEKIASIFKVKEGITGDFSLGTIENQRCYHSFAFCRKNICVLLTTGDNNYDLLPLAREIDAELINGSKSSSNAVTNLENVEVETNIPDSIDSKSATKIKYVIKKQAGSTVEMNVASNGNLRCEKISSQEIMIISQSDNGQGEVGIVLYDPNTLMSRWIKHKVVAKMVSSSQKSF
jgi:hypothetical protein